MKTIKVVTSILSIATLLVLGASRASAVVGPEIVGTVTNFSKATISIVVTTNNTTTSTRNGITTYTTGQLKLGNKELLALFANWTGTELSVWQAAGAQLEYDWEGEPQLIVADKTGTNVLFFAGDGINSLGITAFFSLDFFDRSGPSSGSNGNGTENYTEETIADYELYFHNNSDASQNVDLYGQGPNTAKYSQSAGTKPRWSESQSAVMDNSDDDMQFFNYPNGISVSASVSTKGSGLGSNNDLD